MEQPDACKRHSDAVFVASHDDMIVADAATSLGDELHATLMGTFDIPSCSGLSRLSSLPSSAPLAAS